MTDMMSQPAAKPTLSAAAASRIVRFSDSIIAWTILILAGLVPLFFLPWTIEVSELNKQLVIVVGAAISGIAWFGKMLAERKFEYRRSVVNVMVVLFTAVYSISALFSANRYMSLVGDFGQEMAGLMSLLSYVVLYFVVTNNVRTLDALRKLLYAIVIGGSLTALYALLQGLGIHILPFEFAKTAAFNTVGTSAALGVYLSFVITVASGLLLAGQEPGSVGKKRLWGNVGDAFLAITAAISLFLVACIDYWPVTVCLLVSSILLIAFAFVHAKNVKSVKGVLLPIASFIVALLILGFRFPISLGFPAEVMPSMKASFEIATKTLREDPYFGSGPGTFLFDYAKHHAQDVNGTQFWNIRFDRASSAFLTTLATVGLLGALSWLMVVVFLFVSAVRKLFSADEDTWHVLIALFAGWALLAIARFTYSTTITLEFLFWLATALLVIVHRKDFHSVKFEQSPRSAMTVSFIFILSIVFVLSGIFVEAQRYAAEISYAKAIRTDRAGGDIDTVLTKLADAVNMNSGNDLYRRNLALAFLVKAERTFGEEVKLDKNEGEKQADYDARLKTAQQDQLRKASAYTANAVNVAKSATDINGANVANWAVLASVYQSLIGLSDGASDWAITSYQKAIELEPANPSFHTELGKVYLAQSDAARAGLQSKDEQVKKDAQTKVDDLLNKAVDSFNKAVELKSDFAAARYNLSLALDRQNKLKDAITKMEEVVVQNPTDIGVGFQLSLMYFRDERKDDAIRLLEQVVALSPKYSNAMWYLAAMYEDKKDFDKAIEMIQKVKDLNPDNELVSKKLDELKGKKSGAPTELPAPVEEEGAENPNAVPEVKAPKQ